MLTATVRPDSPATVTVVRSGDATATYVSVNLSGAPDVLPEAVARKQHEKLEAAQERR